MKKFLSVVLTIAMLLSLSVCAFASDVTETQTEGKAVVATPYVEPENASENSTGLQAAVNAAGPNGTVELKTPAENPDANFGGAVIDGGETNLTIEVTGEVVISDPSVGSEGTETLGMQILETSESVTIKGEGEGAEITLDGKSTNDDNESGNTSLKMGINNYTDLTLDNVTIDGTDLSNYNSKNEFNENYVNYVVSNNSGSLTVTNGANILAAEGDIAFDLYIGGPTNSAGDPTYTADVPQITITESAGIIQGTIEIDSTMKSEQLAETMETGEAPSLNIEGGTFENFVLKIGEAVANFVQDIVKISGGSFDSKTVEGKDADGNDYTFEQFVVAEHVVVEQNGRYVVMTQAEADALKKPVVAVIPSFTTDYYAPSSTTNGVISAEDGNAELEVNGETVSVKFDATVVSAKAAPVTLADNAPAEVAVVVSHSALSTNAVKAIEMVQTLSQSLVVKDVAGVELDAAQYEIEFDGYDTINLKLSPELLAQLGTGTHVLTINLGGYEIEVTIVIE